MLVGRSVHDVEAARRAAVEGADYLVVGTLFASRSHPGRTPAGLGLLEEIVAQVACPVLGIGGIGPAAASACRTRGAAGVAVIDAILAAEDPRAAVRQMRDALEAGG
jgi:thiamine-phosphate diphosphorylase